MRLLPVAAVALAFASIAAGPASARDLIGPLVGVDTLTAAESPYKVFGDIRVVDKLTIDPGVELVFQGRHALVVEGTLVAAGRPDAPVSFTGEASADDSRRWRGIRAMPGGRVELSYCVVAHGYADNGQWDSHFDDLGGGLAIDRASAKVRHCLFHDNRATTGGAVYARGRSDVSLDGNLFLANRSSGGAFIYAGGAAVADHSSGGSVELANNLFALNSRNGQEPNSEGGGALQLMHSRARVVHNTFWGNTAAKGSAIHIIGKFEGRLAANLLWHNRGARNGEQISVTFDYYPGQAPPALGLEELPANLIERPQAALLFRNSLEQRLDSRLGGGGDSRGAAPERAGWRPAPAAPAVAGGRCLGRAGARAARLLRATARRLRGEAGSRRDRALRRGHGAAGLDACGRQGGAGAGARLAAPDLPSGTRGRGGAAAHDAAQRAVRRRRAPAWARR